MENSKWIKLDSVYSIPAGENPARPKLSKQASSESYWMSRQLACWSVMVWTHPLEIAASMSQNDQIILTDHSTRRRSDERH
jgi:hypothetical protein